MQLKYVINITDIFLIVICTLCYDKCTDIFIYDCGLANHKCSL